MKIKKATKNDFLELKKLDYENSYDKMFSLESKNNSITLKEIDIEKPIMNANDCYIEEMDDFIRDLDNKNTFAFIAFYEDKPAGFSFLAQSCLFFQTRNQAMVRRKLFICIIRYENNFDKSSQARFLCKINDTQN